MFRHGLQSHAGMGFAWENDLQFALEQAMSAQLMRGVASQHRAQIAEEDRRVWVANWSGLEKRGAGGPT